MSDSSQPELEMIRIACPLCGGEECRRVCGVRDVTYDLPGEFQVVACDHCEHLYLNPRPSDAALMRCYPASYAPYAGQVDGVTAGSAAGSAAPSRLRRVVRSLPGLRRFLRWVGEEHATYLPAPPGDGSRLLEIGCAHGGFLLRARELGWVVDGVEPSRQAAELAWQRGLGVHCGRLSDANLPDQSRDLVAAWMVVEHVPDPVPMLCDVFRILKPAGCVTFSVPNAGAPERRLFGRHWLGYDPPRHLQNFTARRIREILEECGFVEVRIIHQANVRYWWGSIAAWGKLRFPGHRWPDRWLAYFRGDPPRYWRLLSLLPAKLLSMLRMSGRITIVARRPH